MYLNVECLLEKVFSINPIKLLVNNQISNLTSITSLLNKTLKEEKNKYLFLSRI